MSVLLIAGETVEKITGLTSFASATLQLSENLFVQVIFSSDPQI